MLSMEMKAAGIYLSRGLSYQEAEVGAMGVFPMRGRFLTWALSNGGYFF